MAFAISDKHGSVSQHIRQDGQFVKIKRKSANVKPQRTLKNPV